MEEAKAAAYYDELTRKGEGAARFKQGLGFSSFSSPNPPPPSSASSAVFSTFVRASSPSTAAKLEKEAHLHSIHNKLNKPKHHDSDRDLGRCHRHRSSREDDEDTSRSSGRRHRSHSSDEERTRRRRRIRIRSAGRSERRSGDLRDRRERVSVTERNASAVNYSHLIDGYDKMTPAERVKAKMKLLLSETVAKDTNKATGWERFDFNKDAPVDDEEVEVAEDDAALVKDLGRSFRFSALEAKREANIQAAHDQAMFGTTTASLVDSRNDNVEESSAKSEEPSRSTISDNLLSDKVIAMQQGSWRDRAAKLRRGSNQ